MSDRPLLMASKDVYTGPWVFAQGPVSTVCVEGMAEGDFLEIHVRDKLERKEDLIVEITENIRLEIKTEGNALVRAKRVQSTGREVFVWVS